MEITCTPINEPSSSKGWNRYRLTTVDGTPVVASWTGNAWVSAPKTAEVEKGTELILTVQAMRRIGKGRTARENIETGKYTLIADASATATPGQQAVVSGMNGVMRTDLVGGYVTLSGARLK